MHDFNDIIITIDIDWVPDFAIEWVVEKLCRYQVATTWFVTHNSPALQKLKSIDLFELGIHPNFLSGSSHGTTPEEVLEHILTIVPSAVSSRSHAVVQSGPILQRLAHHSPIKIDSTLFLPEMPHIKPLLQHFGSCSLLRIPFIWSDDYELGKLNRNWQMDRFLQIPGLKVLLFHPLQIFLNQGAPRAYQLLKQAVPNLTELTQAQASRFINSEHGVGTLFEDILQHLSTQKTRCLRDFLDAV